MNITQQRTQLSKLTELALMMQIAESFKTVSPQYYNDRMAVLEPEYRQAVRELAESMEMHDNDDEWVKELMNMPCEHSFVSVGEETTCVYCGFSPLMTKDTPEHETLRIPATYHAASKIVPGFKDPYEASCGGQ